MAVVVHLLVILMGVAMRSLGLVDSYLVMATLYVCCCLSLRCVDMLTARSAHVLCSKWYNTSDSDQYKEFCSLLKAGDIVEIRIKYQPDFAICVENNREHGCRLVLSRRSYSAVAIRKFLNPSCDPYECGPGSCETDLGQLTDLVKLQTDWFIEDFNIRINNARDKVSSPKAVEDIVRMMREAVEGEQEKVFGKYLPLTNYVRRFAEQARYPKEALDNRLSRDCSWLLSWWFGDPHCSPWFKKEDRETLRWLLRPWDLVEFDRGLYSHWAILQDRNPKTLFHRSGCNFAEKGPVTTDNITDIIKRSRFRINNSLDKRYKLAVNDLPSYILEGDSVCYGGYNLILNNCKRFAEQLRYGIHFKRNLGLLLCQRSILALRPFLHEGDIISCSLNDEKVYAVYLGKELDKNGLDQVVYGCYHGDQPDGASSARAVPLEGFFESLMPAFEFVYIDNRLDHKHPPLELEEIVETSKKVIGQRYTCNGCPYENTKLFAQQIRNGSEKKRAARTPSLTSKSWKIMVNLYSACHHLICKDCHPS